VVGVGVGNTALILVGRIVNIGLDTMKVSDAIGDVDGGGATVDDVVDGGSTDVDVDVVVVEVDGGGGASVVL
jgi:hypothetical protein